MDTEENKDQANQESRATKMNLNKNQIILGVVAAAFIFVSIYIVYMKYSRPKAVPNPAALTQIKAAEKATQEIDQAAHKLHDQVQSVEKNLSRVTTTTTMTQPAEVYETPALLIANNKLRITSLKSSKVKALPFKDGQNFAKDDVLVMFDCKELELDYAIQKAVVKERAARVENLKKLQKLNSTSEYSVIEAESLSEQANKLNDKMEYQLANCVIKANYAGKVISTQVTEAEYATAGQDVMTVTNNEDLLVKAYIQASWLKWLKLGNKFKFCFSETNDCFAGTVVRIGAEVDPTSQTIDVFGKLNNASPEKLIPGLSAQVTFKNLNMQVENISKLLALQNSLYDYSDFKAIIDFIVNDTYKIIQYQLGVIVERDPNKPQSIHILQISGTIDTKDQEVSKSFKSWLHKTLQNVVVSAYPEENSSNKKQPSVVIVHPNSLDSKIRADWAENLGQELIVTKLYSNKEDKKELFLILFNNALYPEPDIINLNLIIKAYNQSITLSLKDDIVRTRKSSNELRNKIIFGSLGLALIALFFPITPTVLAPAQIISEKTWLINAPVNGVVKSVHVEPNTRVNQKQLLLSYDKLDLNNTLKLKQQEQKSLETELNQTQALGFEDKEQRGKTFRLQQDIQAKKQEIFYATQQLELSDITAPEAGVVLFKSKDDLLGKPVKIGETLVKLADQNQQSLEIWLNINDNINLKKGMGLYYYSNKSPFRGIWAELDNYSYEAYVTPQKHIAYRLVAKFKDPKFKSNNDLIIGDQGQAKIYALKRTTLARYIFQKPLAKFRQWYYGVI